MYLSYISVANLRYQRISDKVTVWVCPRQVREQLVRAAEVLSRAAATLFPARRAASRERARQHMVQHYHEHKHAEHHRVLQRHKIIEERKEYIERLNSVREEEELRYDTLPILYSLHNQPVYCIIIANCNELIKTDVVW